MPTTTRPRTRRFDPDCPSLVDAPKLLFVDDDGDVLDTYRARLRRYRVNVLAAESGRDGLQIARDTRPDLVVTDVGMARGDGDYLVGKLKKRRHTARIPVIVISGLDDPELAIRMYEAGACRFLRKPVSFDRLVAEIGRFVEIEQRNTVISSAPVPTSTLTSSDASGRRFRFDEHHGRPVRLTN